MTFKFTPLGPRHVAIVGSRHITSYPEFCKYVRPLLRRDDIIVSGGADGVDSLARRYAKQNKHKLVEYVINKDLVHQEAADEGIDYRVAFARAAYARNQQIVDHLTAVQDVMIAIACTHSKGTIDSIARMQRRLRNLGIDPKAGGGIYLFNYVWNCEPGLVRRKGREIV